MWRRFNSRMEAARRSKSCSGGFGLRRQDYGNACAGFVGLNLQHSFELADAFAHTAETDAGTFRANLVHPFGSDAAALILDGKVDHARVAAQVDDGSFAAGVTVDVSQGFLYDA